MGKKKRLAKAERRRTAAEAEPDGSGSFVEDVGLFETANGLPHGPAAVVIAIAAALVIYPIRRLVRFLSRR